ncbi:MAG: PIG-L family deacetylase [Candidatus Hydrogenedentes bacterium]|nr:PIG-L family deacetylase [Candidatus Hydrogenedentota bacterium]
MRILCFGAHPDDAEWYAGGSLVYWASGGHEVYAISVTNGNIGHHIIKKESLASVRKREAEESARIGGYKSIVLDYPDGELVPSIELRKHIVKIIRELQADVVITHRPVDYHPDHRACGIVIQDAVFLVTVPQFVSEVPALSQSPLCLYMMDMFKKPYPFSPDFAVDVTDYMEKKWDLLDAMPSQMYEWLPYLDHQLSEVPTEPNKRKEWLKLRWESLFRLPSIIFGNEFKDEVSNYTGKFEFVEFFELSEYGRKPTKAELDTLFTFWKLSDTLI